MADPAGGGSDGGAPCAPVGSPGDLVHRSTVASSRTGAGLWGRTAGPSRRGLLGVHVWLPDLVDLCHVAACDINHPDHVPLRSHH